MLVQKNKAAPFFHTLHLMTDKVLPGYACQQATAGRYSHHVVSQGTTEVPGDDSE